MPTRDIHLKQLDLEETWLEFLEQFVMPLQEVAFEGYASEVGFLSFLIVRLHVFHPLIRFLAKFLIG